MQATKDNTLATAAATTAAAPRVPTGSEGT